MKSLFFVFLALFSATAYSQVKITVLPNSALNQQYTQPVRWQQVLASLHAAGVDPRWSVLTRQSEDKLAELTELHRQVTDRLERLGQYWARQGNQGGLRSAYELLAQLHALPLAAYQPVSMDYDLVRLQPEQNPLLDGNYTITLRDRPDFVWAQGLIRLPGKRPFVGGAFAYDYGKRLSTLPEADSNNIWVIQPDGVVMTSGVDPFAPEFVGVAPGATLYVGFKQLPAAFTGLNRQIMTLLANRQP
ncbi:capsule biosynthesis GfcC family protein [uncultured Oceanisphaera sp.]|uniref:capsule biosynthesis GfcC family protein n=1 Tax=uncultured Oceanisphaera sp. TaxID=353858 RepID=UPI002628F56E|nr:capsule biosynthesis GfcC family protein [uncultured Oceanisphaera sp.]